MEHQLRTLEDRSQSKHSDRLIQITFPPDSKLIASQDSGGFLKLWDASSGKALDILRYPFDYYGKISFSDGSVLQSNGKPFYIISSREYGVDLKNSVRIDREWVLWGTERMLWLPPEYRPGLFEMWRDSVAICLQSGLVVFINFALED